MLTDEKKSILQLLVALAWADGRVDESEREIVLALTEAFQASDDETTEMMDWASQRRTLDEVDISHLSRTDIDLVLQYAVLLTFVDGEQTADEIELLYTFIDRIGLSRDEAQPILESATAFSKSLLSELAS
ncbi:MAG: TerB family tellurite resistance protein [Deltaproteobacteria bacterium]|nr:TerB family tellurite resistance protein [Deltaproteobacteria bacterium]